MSDSKQWIILTLDPATTNEADLRRTLANKLKAPYEIYCYTPRYSNGTRTVEVAVLSNEDDFTVRQSFDVIDKKYSWYFNGTFSIRVLEGRK